MRPAVAPRLFMPDRDKRMTLIFRLEPVIKNLPYDFDIMRAEACSEGYRFVERLATAWEAGVRSPSYSNFRQKDSGHATVVNKQQQACSHIEAQEGLSRQLVIARCYTDMLGRSVNVAHAALSPKLAYTEAELPALNTISVACLAVFAACVDASQSSARSATVRVLPTLTACQSSSSVLYRKARPDRSKASACPRLACTVASSRSPPPRERLMVLVSASSSRMSMA